MEFKELKDGQKSGLTFSFFVTFYLLILYFFQLFTVEIFKADALTARVVSSLALPFCVVTVLFILKVKESRPFLQACGVKKSPPVYVVVAVGISAGMFCGLGFVNGLIAKWLNLEGTPLPLDGWLSFSLLVIAIAVLPAIFEELIFRGVILDKLNGVKPYVKILFVGGIFALFHGSLNQLVYQFIYGALLAFLTLKAGSVIPAVISHFLNNFVIILLTFLGVDVNLYNGFIIGGGLLVLALTVLFLIFYKPFIKEEYAENKTHAVGFLVFSAIGVLVCVAVIICGLIL